ncbi:MAG: hypothetical protein ACYTGW_18460 [Planctomycetota bacterium]|jgi:hypothetical protein
MQAPLLPCLLLVAISIPTSGCSIFEFSEYDGFGEWLIGPPGFSKMLYGTDSSEGIYGDRPFIYGPFRLPELVFQPVGGLKYPKRRTITNESLGDAMAAAADAQSQARATGYGQASYTRVTRVETGADNCLAFDWFDSGIVEIIPYRAWASEKGVGYKLGVTAMQPLNGMMMVMMDTMRLPFYFVHDALKTVTIPVAAAYYATKDDGKGKKSPGKKATATRAKAKQATGTRAGDK